MPTSAAIKINMMIFWAALVSARGPACLRRSSSSGSWTLR